MAMEDKVEEQDDGTDGKRERSKIDFPYMDLEAAVTVANGIHARVGGGTCQHDELAVQLGLSPSSSGYRTRISTARLFGLMTSARGSDGVRLTDLGARVVDPSQAREARARAFLTIPLFKKVYDDYRGRVLPPAAALQREMVNWGVAQKQAERARQIMERSADTAGFFESGRDRLVMPAGIGAQPTTQAPSPEVEKPQPNEGERKNGSGNDGGNGKLHPFIQGLLQTLPEPQTDWSATERMKWLQTAANIFDLIYKGEGGVEVRVAAAHRSPRPD